MTISPLAGTLMPPSALVDVAFANDTDADRHGIVAGHLREIQQVARDALALVFCNPDRVPA